ncbi:hypothetical protein F4825DRAFT_452364 [Nemania diffusa]|nr:hypothetical protein F4825DRAFT_452364 [Nemania diffusa]
MLIIDQAPSVWEELSVVHDIPVQHQEDHEVTNVEWKGKGKAILLDSEEPVADPEMLLNPWIVDWTEYEPPDGLKFTGDIDPELVILIQESIDRIKTRILEEGERKSAAEAAKQKQKEKADQEEGNPEKSETSPHDDWVHPDELHQPLDPEEAQDRDQDAPRARKQGGFLGRTVMSLFRKLNGSAEHGESSSAGAARHRLLAQSSQVELTTHSARKRFVLDLLKKNTGENKSTGSTASIQEAEVECVSCLDDFDPKDTVKAPCHHYCKPCFRRLIASACQNEQHWPPKCCLNTIPESTITPNIEADQQLEYRERAQEWNLPIAQRIYCSEPGCSLFIRPAQIDAAEAVARCAEGHATCTHCRNAQHGGAACPQDRDLAATTSLAAAEGWKRCYGCGAYVEHREACQHMTCRCGAQFCYVCGARWHTCDCTMEELRDIKQQASARRAERAARDDAEAAAVLEAIRLVEEFQREEALKAELLRAEQARIAQERHARELAAKIRRERARRHEVGLRYGAARAAFAKLHEAQRALVLEAHEARAKQARDGSAAAEREIGDAYAAEEARATVRVAAREAAFKAEYAARAAEERDIEAQYAARLEVFWGAREKRRKNKDSADGAENARVAMDELRRRMDAGFRAWRRWMDGELDAYRYQVGEELAIRRELAEEASRRLWARARTESREVADRKIAELRWVREVVEERKVMLEERERDEVENGEDIDTWFAEDPLEEVILAADS